MPTATTTAKGLMSANDKKYGINYFYIQGTTLIKLCSSSTTWKRNGGFILVSTGTDVGMILFSMQKNSTGWDYKIKALVKNSSMRFYLKEDSLYFYYATNTGTFANIFGISGDSFTNMGLIPKLDDSYTEIPIE